MARAPRILPLVDVYRLAGVPVDPTDGRWLVVEAGEFGGQRWELGTIVVVGEAGARGEVLLVPRGAGRARFGVREGHGLFGDAGEPCSSDRFVVIGRPVVGGVAAPAVARWCGGGLVLRTLQSRPLTVAPPAAAVAPAVQLPLFAAAA